MPILLSLALGFVAAALTGLVAIFLTEVIAGLASPRLSIRTKDFGEQNVDARIAVLVPAYNESTGLAPTIADIKRQLRAGDRLLVVADNCSDDTAAVALAHGAEVIERNDVVRRGKGYALDFGLNHLSAVPPKILIMIDADCHVANGCIGALTKACTVTARPAQALYLMTPPPNAEINQRVAEFAWRVKNWLRPSGLAALGLPCQLMGTGMAFPWDVIRSVDLASGSIVEDLKLGLDLMAKGHPPVFCPSALITSQFAPTAQASRTQRERWEAGHVAMILSTVPRLLGKAIARRDLNLLALTLDLMVPPLSLLAFLIVVMLAGTFLWAAFGLSHVPFLLSAASFTALVLTGFAGWVKCGRDILPASQLPSIIAYVFKKLGLYRVILSDKTVRSWTRTERKNPKRPTL